MPDKDTWIYLIHDVESGCVKIGRSIDPHGRLREIKRQPLVLPKPHHFILVDAWYGKESDERVLHKRYAERRVRGEWFRLDTEAIREIEAYFYDNKNLVTGQTPHQVAAEYAREAGMSGPDFYMGDPSSGDFLDFAVEGFGFEM